MKDWNRKSDILQGTLALLVLKTLQMGPMHGWGITLHIQQISQNILRVEEGSFYPALHRMGAGRLDLGGMGRFRKQSTRALLTADCRGPKAT